MLDTNDLEIVLIQEFWMSSFSTFLSLLYCLLPTGIYSVGSDFFLLSTNFMYRILTKRQFSEILSVCPLSLKFTNLFFGLYTMENG